MNETTPFFQSFAFDVILLLGGIIFGFFVAALLASSGQASRDEERWEEDAHAHKITNGKPDRE
jgi:hypothetical protein